MGCGQPLIQYRSNKQTEKEIECCSLRLLLSRADIEDDDEEHPDNIDKVPVHRGC